jgi:hypothetical protein
MIISKARFIRPKYEAFHKWKNVVKLSFPLYDRGKRYKGIIYELMSAKNDVYLKKHKEYKILVDDRHYKALISLGKVGGLARRTGKAGVNSLANLKKEERRGSKENLHKMEKELQTYQRKQARNMAIQASASLGVLAGYNNGPQFKTMNQRSSKKLKRSKTKKSVIFATTDDRDLDKNPFATPGKKKRSRSRNRS